MNKPVTQPLVFLDFETYSATSIDKGIENYLADPEADIVLLSMKIGRDGKTALIDFRKTLPMVCYDPRTIFYAHNAAFDFRVWNRIGVKKYGFPETKITQWRDSMALCGRYGVRLKLEHAPVDMGARSTKLDSGTSLIKKISCPTPEGRRPVLGINYTKQDWENYGAYAIGDVDAMVDLIYSFPSPKLNDYEQRVWELTQKMNFNGVPIDTESVNAILERVEAYIESRVIDLPKMTGGYVNTVGQIDKIKGYCATQGVELKDLQEKTVTRVLEDTTIPDSVRDVLQTRADVGQASTKKYAKIKELVHHGRVHDNLCFYGASTGRWAGRGFQFHNLPRAKIKDPVEREQKIQDFKELDYFPNMMWYAKALVRPMICAPQGKKIIVADYSGIENVLLHWLANDWKTLEKKRNGVDLYKEMASFLFQVKYENVTGEQRNLGKAIILGCGYAMGARTFQASAANYGIKLTLKQAEAAVNAFRTMFPEVKIMWWKLTDAVKMAINHPGYEVKTKYHVSCVVLKSQTGDSWLKVNLPSGRALFYRKPAIIEGIYGPVASAMGVKNYKYQRLELSPSRIIENIDQAVARDIMCQGLINLDERMPEVMLLGCIHDEGIGEIADEDIKEDTLEVFKKHLCDIPWLDDRVPLKASGYIEQRFKKD